MKTLLVTLADKGYLNNAKQFFSSVYHNAGWKGDYMLLAHEIPESDLVWFREKGILVKECQPIGDVTLDKFYLFTEEFKKWDNVVFLDADIIVRYSLDKLAKVKGFYAAPDIHRFLRDHFDEPLNAPYASGAKAFNTGVMAFSTDVIAEDSFAQLIDIYNKYREIGRFAEQPFINLYFYKKWKKLNSLFNVFVPIMLQQYHLQPKKIDGTALHFLGSEKPWHPHNPFHKEWEENLKKAELIDLGNRSEEVRAFGRIKRILYRSYIFFYKMIVSLYFFIDKQIGRCGLLLKEYFPAMYGILRKKQQNDEDFIVAGDKDIDAKVRAHASPTNDFFFIQIGSNDGSTLDPIHHFIKRYGWKGILVEPVAYLFEKLKETYRTQEGLSFENAAIGDGEDDEKIFYRIEKNNEPNNPLYYDQLGSFKKEVIEKHRSEIPNFDKHLVSEKVHCISFASLISKHQVKKIDFLHIDTEGYDYEIIKTIPFDVAALKPKMILYEHAHLSDPDTRECQVLLGRNGYSLIKAKYDTFAHLSPHPY